MDNFDDHYTSNNLGELFFSKLPCEKRGSSDLKKGKCIRLGRDCFVSIHPDFAKLIAPQPTQDIRFKHLCKLLI